MSEILTPNDFDVSILSWVEDGAMRQAGKRHDAALRAENARLRADYTNACSTIAAMHAAAVGEVRGSTLGVVEDVATVREAANRLRQKMRETYADHRYMNVWATAQERLGPYTGPNWIAEAESLDAALAAPPEEKENHE